jgi:DNA-directed RNA polymerase subunit E'/Rpb7
MENPDIFVKVLLSEKVKLEPKYIHKNFKKEVLRRLQQKLENICSKHGFIKQHSIEIYKVQPGLVELVSLNGYIQYDVHFHALVCNPLVGTIIEAKVTNTNRFGILAEAGSILEIIIAKNSVSIISDVNLDDIKVGDGVKVEVIGKKYELNDKKISIVGRIIKDVSTSKKKSVTNNVTNEEDEESNEEDVIPLEDDEDSSSTTDSQSEDEDTDASEEDHIDDLEESDHDNDDDDASTKKKSGGTLFSDDEGGNFDDDDLQGGDVGDDVEDDADEDDAF